MSRKRIYTINVNVKEGKDLIDQIKSDAKEYSISVSRLLIGCYQGKIRIQERKCVESKANDATSHPSDAGEGMEGL